MQTFTNLEEARVAGTFIGYWGEYPSVYQNRTNNYILVERGEWPPAHSRPFLKWDGTDWLPVLTRLDTLEQAIDATRLFSLLGHRPIIVEFPGITFDIFFRESDVPQGAWIVSDANLNCFTRCMKSPNDDESDILESKSLWP